MTKLQQSTYPTLPSKMTSNPSLIEDLKLKFPIALHENLTEESKNIMPTRNHILVQSLLSEEPSTKILTQDSPHMKALVVH